MRRSPPVRAILSVLVLLHTAAALDDALKCADHPANAGNALTSVLVSSWDYELSSNEYQQLGYLARYTGHAYAPLAEPASAKYRGLDLFHTADFLRAPNFRIHFQREALVYLFVNLDALPADTAAPVSLRGWTSVGYAARVEGPATIAYGVHQTLARAMPQHVYVFSKTTNGKMFVDVPQTRFVKKKIEGVSAPGSFNLWIAEADGSPSPDPGLFQGAPVAPNQQCPPALHDLWMTEKADDPSVAGQKFPSWHPAWDPCFWCTYGHEHGSDPGLLGYRPTFTYTAFKNNEVERDQGFKGFTLRIGSYYFYYSIHVEQSSLRRVTVRNHTVGVVIYDRRSKEVVADFAHKGDFGWQSVRLNDGDYAAFLEEDVAIKARQDAEGLPEVFRSINVLIPGSPNPAFAHRRPPSIGQYEVWDTLPICAQPKNRRAMLSASFRLPNTGIRTLEEPDVVTTLGLDVGGTFIKNVGLNRALRVSKMKFSAEFCPTDPGTGAAASGVFYTDASGANVVAGPGPGALRQFFKPGFTLEVNGRFEVVDPTSGEYRRGSRGFFTDHSYGVDPTKN